MKRPAVKTTALLLPLAFASAAAAAPTFREVRVTATEILLDLPAAGEWEIFVNRGGNLRQWQTVPARTERPAGSGVLRFSVARADVPGSSAFFRAAVRADSDGDGLTDGSEILIWGSDPLLPDTDADGQPDGQDPDPTDEWDNLLPTLVRQGPEVQFGTAGSFLLQPMEVRVTDAGGHPAVRKTVTFRVQKGGGKLSNSPATTATLTNLQVQTSPEGVARVWWLCGPDRVQRATSGVMSRKNLADAGGGLRLVEFKAWSGSLTTPTGTALFLPPAPDSLDDNPLSAWTDRSGNYVLARLPGASAATVPAVLLLNGLPTVHFDGMDDVQGLALLRSLTEHATAARYCHTYNYAIGDVVVWDNAQLLHAAPLTQLTDARTLWRITVKEAA